MIRKYFKRFSIITSVIIILFVLINKSFWVSQTQRFLDENSKYQSQILSEINLSLSSAGEALRTRQGLSEFLQLLDSNPGVVFWQLKNKSGNVISKKIGGEAPTKGGTIFYTYFASENGGVVTLELSFKRVASFGQFFRRN